MAAGKEIKRLRGKKVSAADAATLIGVKVDRLRKWEERDTDPSDTGDVQKVESYFGVSLPGLKSLKNFDFVEFPRGNDMSEKYIKAIERERNRLEKDLDLSLGELRHNVLLSRAIAETNQEMLAELLAKQTKRPLAEELDSASIKSFERYTKLKEEGNFGYVGK